MLSTFLGLPRSPQNEPVVRDKPCKQQLNFVSSVFSVLKMAAPKKGVNAHTRKYSRIYCSIDGDAIFFYLDKICRL